MARATSASSTGPRAGELRNLTPTPSLPETATELLLEIRQEIARQNELHTQTLQLLLQLVRERSEEGDANG